MGTPPTGSNVLGVSSEWGRSRVAQPAAKMTAFIWKPAPDANTMHVGVSATWHDQVSNFHHLCLRSALDPPKSCHLLATTIRRAPPSIVHPLGESTPLQ